MGRSLQRLKQIAKPDSFDDQKTPTEIENSEANSNDFEEFLDAVLSQLKRIIFGNLTGDWKTDPNVSGLSARAIHFQNDVSVDQDVQVVRDVSDNLTFKDKVVSGIITLAELVAHDYKLPREYIGPDETILIDENKQWIAYHKVINDGRIICDGLGVVIENG